MKLQNLDLISVGERVDSGAPLIDVVQLRVKGGSEHLHRPEKQDDDGWIIDRREDEAMWEARKPKQ